ncbi:MAG: hypothetical protein IT495_19680 [Gammaproteobacteria bacterium]|nr:hypothetical protein [Gammaproteobacteria bacterium]
MAYVVGQTAHLGTFPLTDASGALVTGKVNANWTKLVKRNGATIADTVTVTEDSDDAGYYTATVVPSQTGVYTVILLVTVDGATKRFLSDPIHVITAAQADPAAALASTVSAVTTLTERLTSARAARLDLITTGRITTRQPVSVDGTISLRPGESYLAVDGRQIDLTSDGWPDLDGATITFAITALGAASATIIKAAAIVAATAPDQTVRIELTTAETALLSRSGVYRYSIDATIGGDPYHLASDSVAVLG